MAPRTISSPLMGPLESELAPDLTKVGPALVAELRGRRVPTFVARAARDFTKLLVVEHLVLAMDLQAETIARAALVAEAPHPRLTRIRATIERPGGIDVVSDFIDGESLVDLQTALRAKGIAMPSMCALRIISDVLSGLNALHRMAPFAATGHGDLSPHNVMVGLDGRVRLVEIVRDGREPRREDAARFVAPEVLAGGASSPGSDIYTAGVMFAEVLSGGDALTTEYAAPFLEVAKRASSASPTDRFSSAAEMLSTLASHFRDQAPSHADVARLMSTVAREEIEARRTALEEAPLLGELEVRLALAPPPSMPVTFSKMEPLPGSRATSNWPGAMDSAPVSAMPPSSSRALSAAPPISRQTDRPPGFSSAPPSEKSPHTGPVSPFASLAPSPAGPADAGKRPASTRPTLQIGALRAPLLQPSAPPQLLPLPLPKPLPPAEPGPPPNVPGAASGSWRYASAKPVDPPRRVVTQPVPHESIVVEQEPAELAAQPEVRPQRTQQPSAPPSPVVKGPVPQAPAPPVAPASFVNLPPMRKQATTGPDLAGAAIAVSDREQRSPRLIVLCLTLILVGVAVGVVLTQSRHQPQQRNDVGAVGQGH